MTASSMPGRLAVMEGWLGGFETEGHSRGFPRIGFDKQNAHSEVGKGASQIYCDCCLSRSALVTCNHNLSHDLIEYEEVGKSSSTDTNMYR